MYIVYIYNINVELFHNLGFMQKLNNIELSLFYIKNYLHLQMLNI